MSAFCLKPITFVPQQTEKRYISRHQMFEPAKVLEALQLAVSRTRRGESPPSKGRKVKSACLPVVFSNSQTHGESPMPQNC